METVAHFVAHNAIRITFKSPVGEWFAGANRIDVFRRDAEMARRSCGRSNEPAFLRFAALKFYVAIGLRASAERSARGSRQLAGGTVNSHRPEFQRCRTREHVQLNLV